ncbi:MAG: nuclear transport factor 2 family protein [Planctomycetota bacterium]
MHIGLVSIALLIGQIGEQPATEDPADAVSAVVANLYDVISGPAGEERDWDRFRELFAEDARLASVRKRDGVWAPGGVTPEGYIEASGEWLETNGFFEVPLYNEIDVYGGIAQVFSSYEARSEEDGPIIARGINSIQLVRIGDDWKLLSVIWSSEDNAGPIPARYLPPVE